MVSVTDLNQWCTKGSGSNPGPEKAAWKILTSPPGGIPGPSPGRLAVQDTAPGGVPHLRQQVQLAKWAN